MIVSSFNKSRFISSTEGTLYKSEQEDVCLAGVSHTKKLNDRSKYQNASLITQLNIPLR